MGKKIVGKLDNSFEKIEFYEIVDNYKHFTIIRKQGTSNYYAWDNKLSVLSEKLDIIYMPEDVELLEDVINNMYVWYPEVFFWADSKFVTDYGLPHYDKLIDIYIELVNIRITELKIKETIRQCRENDTFINYIKNVMLANKFLRRQKRTVRELEKEFKVIW